MIRRNNLLVWVFLISACLIAVSVARKAIIGGNKADVGQFKYQVSVQYNGRHICGGGIVGRKYIITAASCVLEDQGHVKYLSLTVLLGTNDLNKRSEPALTCQVHKFYTPVDFSPPRDTTGDIAVLELHQDLPLTHQRHLRPLQLPGDRHDTFRNTTGVIAGFGWTWINSLENGVITGGGVHDTRLRWTKVHVLGTSDPCYHNRTNIICARVEQRVHQTRGTCFGDTGSPLVHFATTVVGVLTSFPESCSERERSGIYTRVTEYVLFIRYIKMNRINKYIREYVLP